MTLSAGNGRNSPQRRHRRMRCSSGCGMPPFLGFGEEGEPGSAILAQFTGVGNKVSLETLAIAVRSLSATGNLWDLTRPVVLRMLKKWLYSSLQSVGSCPTCSGPETTIPLIRPRYVV